MIPKTNTVMTDVETQPTNTYKLQIEKDKINGYCDGQEAVKQAVHKILNTERYQYIIYSWNYGVELFDLFGRPVSYVCSEIPRRITEALLQDDRIISVDGFSFNTTQKRTVTASFTVHTIFGDIDTEKVVNY